MKKFYFLLAMVAVAVTSCQKDVVYNDMPEQNQSVELPSSNTRSYDEALTIAEDALKLLESDETRSTTKRVIKRNEGQTVLRPVTRGGEENDDPIMYVFNNEDNMGFTVVAADRSQQPLIAVTEYGNYTYGEPTGVEPFDVYIDQVASQLMILPDPIIPLPDVPLEPTPGCIVDTVDIFTRVDPLLTTKWGQYGIYNDLCYDELSQECPAGCVATAIAQIIAYQKHPSQLQITFDGDYLGDTLYLNWTNILRHTHNIGLHAKCSREHMNISKLFREIGERVEMKYNPRGSATSDAKALNFLKSVGFTSAKWKDGMSYALTKCNLIEGNPVYMGGYRYDAVAKEYYGHAWVADGVHDREYGTILYVSNPNYDPNIIYNNPEPEYIIEESNIQIERMLHFNWGYDGDCNGWFAIDNICMKEGVEYDSSTHENNLNRNYEYSMSIIYDIFTW